MHPDVVDVFVYSCCIVIVFGGESDQIEREREGREREREREREADKDKEIQEIERQGERGGERVCFLWWGIFFGMT